MSNQDDPNKTSVTENPNEPVLGTDTGNIALHQSSVFESLEGEVRTTITAFSETGKKRFNEDYIKYQEPKEFTLFGGEKFIWTMASVADGLSESSGEEEMLASINTTEIFFREVNKVMQDHQQLIETEGTPIDEVSYIVDNLELGIPQILIGIADELKTHNGKIKSTTFCACIDLITEEGSRYLVTVNVGDSRAVVLKRPNLDRSMNRDGVFIPLTLDETEASDYLSGVVLGMLESYIIPSGKEIEEGYREAYTPLTDFIRELLNTNNFRDQSTESLAIEVTKLIQQAYLDDYEGVPEIVRNTYKAGWNHILTNTLPFHFQEDRKIGDPESDFMINPTVTTKEINIGDIVFVLSDGLEKGIKFNDLKAAIRKSGSVLEGFKSLMERIRDIKDNVSAVVIQH